MRAVVNGEKTAYSNRKKVTVAAELNAEQIYAKCSPAVFYIEVADRTGAVFASGSGFFIASDGTAVTNYHVIEGAYSATITLSSGTKYSVAGVYDYDVSHGVKFIALFLTMICCIILGMGVPTTANYCIMASTCAPILIELGIPNMAAHFFVFYFGIVADITPPVALAGPRPLPNQ